MNRLPQPRRRSFIARWRWRRRHERLYPPSAGDLESPPARLTWWQWGVLFAVAALAAIILVLLSIDEVFWRLLTWPFRRLTD